MIFFKSSLIIVFFCLVSCSKDPSVFKLTNLNDDEIGCFGHAGMGSNSIYPANTLKSLKLSLERGADGTEMDIQVTKDSVLVISHNEQLADKTSCSGNIKDLNWNDISDCKVNSILLQTFNLITFDDFIQNISVPTNYTFTLDCKSDIDDVDKESYYRLFTRTLIKTIVTYNLQQNIFIENHDPVFLNMIKEISTEVKLFLVGDSFESNYEIASSSSYYGLSIDNTLITKEQVDLAHKANLRITVYGVLSEKENYSAVEKSPDFIQTDNLEYLLKIFGKYNRIK